MQPFSKVEDEYLLLFEKYSGTTAPKTIYLEDIAEAFDECMDGWVQFLNVCTGEIVSLSEDPYMACEEDKELWEVIEETDDYVRLPDQYDLRKTSRMKQEMRELRKYWIMRCEEDIRTEDLKIKSMNLESARFTMITEMRHISI